LFQSPTREAQKRRFTQPPGTTKIEIIGTAAIQRHRATPGDTGAMDPPRRRDPRRLHQATAWLINPKVIDGRFDSQRVASQDVINHRNEKMQQSKQILSKPIK
jgi:hypothetical protein